MKEMVFGIMLCCAFLPGIYVTTLTRDDSIRVIVVTPTAEAPR